MRLHLSILIIFLISLILPAIVNADRVNCILGNEEDYENCVREHGSCSKDEAGDRILVCWAEREEREPTEEPEIPPLPEGTELNAQIVSEREIILNLETKDNERAEFILKLIEDKIGDEFILKPTLNINMDIKGVSKIPPKVDTKLIPYFLYLNLALSALSLIILILIIKDTVEPKFRL